MIARIVDDQWVYMTHITDPEDQILWEKFSVSKPNAYVDPSVRGNWDGIYRKYNRAKKRIARPLLGMLYKICKENNIPLSVEDEREPWEYKTIEVDEVTPDLLKGITLEEYQVNAIKKCVRTECGIIEIPTGGGKGEVICGICAAIECPTLILADQRVVVEQLKRRLELRDVAGEVGLFYAGKKPSGQMIVVGLIQSLTPPKKPEIPERKSDEPDKAYQTRLKRYDQKLKAYRTRLENVKFLMTYVKNAGMIIVDECDKATSKSFKQLFKFYFKGRRRYGCSGTPFDPDKPVEAVEMQEHLGSVIFKESRDTVLKMGRIVPTTYKMIAIGLEGRIDESSTYDIAYEQWLIENINFHDIIGSLVKKYEDEAILILVDREKVGTALEEKIRSLGYETHFIYGKTSKRRRDEILKRYEERKFNVLIGGKIINRGLDLTGGCDKLILAGGGKLQSDLVQKVGRALRRNEKGYSVVFDFFFRCNKHLYKHSKSRLKAMVNSGFETKIIFPGGVIDGRELIEKRRFRVDRKYLSRAASG
jgi:superfamily II DNA or RNA helicase